jgi:hypothetical protein
MHNIIATLVAPAAHQNNWPMHPRAKLRVARGPVAPSGEVRLTRGLPRGTSPLYLLLDQAI